MLGRDFAKIVDQVPDSRVWCSCYGSGECCKKHTERYGMHNVRVSARLDKREAGENIKELNRMLNLSTLISRPPYIFTAHIR